MAYIETNCWGDEHKGYHVSRHNLQEIVAGLAEFRTHYNETPEFVSDPGISACMEFAEKLRIELKTQLDSSNHHADSNQVLH